MYLLASSHFFTNLALMNVQQAKDIDINDLLQGLGHQPTKQTAKDAWYRRPYGQERHASFHVSRDGRAWFDFGTGTGGNIIDLAMRLSNSTSVATALTYLEQLTSQRGSNLPSTRPTRQLRQALPVGYTIEAVKAFSYPQGEAYLQARGIEVDTVRPYLHDVSFYRPQAPSNRLLYGFGLPNLSHGFEIRTKLEGTSWLKSSLGQKDITVFESSRDKAPWLSFEGLPDFCTFLTVDKPPINTYHYLILNGTGLTHRAVEYLTTQPTGSLIICSQAGLGGQHSKQALVEFATQAGWAYGDMDQRWQGFTDYNEKHMSALGLHP